MSTESFTELVDSVSALDRESARAAQALQDRLTKPQGSLGFLEVLGVQLAAIAGTCPPPVPQPVTIGVFAGDHGVVDAGVTPWPKEVTAQMVANFCGGGAAINVLARHTSAHVVVVDVGVNGDLDPAPNLLRRKVRPGTANIVEEPAMTRGEAQA